MGQPLLQSMFLSVVTPDEVHKIIISLKSGATVYDELPVSVLKMISSSITRLLPYLGNLSIDQGDFPMELKLANVIPLYKADDPCSLDDYKPVSLLVFEKVMYNRLVEYLDMLHILNDRQTVWFQKISVIIHGLDSINGRINRFTWNGEIYSWHISRFFESHRYS